ncbi:MAG: hypothetical protein JNL26_02630, partial [Gemmatimonadetes bacterium]|nr:hypothetical protein [Gemmatimonadota bacterium]
MTAALACGEGGTSPGPGPGIAVRSRTPASRLEVGDTVRLELEVRGANGAVVERPVVAFRSLTPDIAVIGDGPVIHALRPGRATIELSVTGPAPAVQRTLVDTTELDIERILMASVRIDAPGAALIAGDTLRLRASAVTARGASFAGATFTWSSRTPDVASVSRDGVLQML